MVAEHTFLPDYSTAPGVVIEEILEAREMAKVELAGRCGLTPKTISMIINGKAAVTPETAIQLERVLGISASVWNNLESNYRLFLAKGQDINELERQEDWLQGFPIKEMVRRRWISKGNSTVENIAILLNYFGVGTVASWEDKYGNLSVRLRKSVKYKPTREALAAWIRKSEIEASNVDTNAYSKGNMEHALSEIRGLSCQEPQVFEPQMRRLMANAGVALVFIGELSGTHLSGATRWLSPNKAMMALSLRYKTDDHLWFTFFHEAAHIEFHSKKLSFIDGIDNKNDDRQEVEADQFASDYLIPPRAYKRFLKKDTFAADDIRKFADELGIATGIIVGRLQHEGLLKWNELNYLKCKFVLKE